MVGRTGPTLARTRESPKSASPGVLSLARSSRGESRGKSGFKSAHADSETSVRHTSCDSRVVVLRPWVRPEASDLRKIRLPVAFERSGMKEVVRRPPPEVLRHCEAWRAL